jgi:hypothetical protein
LLFPRLPVSSTSFARRAARHVPLFSRLSGRRSRDTVSALRRRPSLCESKEGFMRAVYATLLGMVAAGSAGGASAGNGGETVLLDFYNDS